MAVQDSDLTRLAQVVALGLALVSIPASTDAYCVDPTYAAKIRHGFPTMRLPVYLSTGQYSSIEHTGLSPFDAARILLEVIARHNETAIAPKLYFAGFTASDFTLVPMGMQPDMVNSIATWPKGIVVHGFPCALVADVNDRIHPTFLCNADTVLRHACAYQHNNGTDWVGVVGLLPPQCDLAQSKHIEWSLDDSTAYDFALTLLHELGHVLGLEHCNVSAVACGSKIPGNDPDGNDGVMRTAPGGSLSALRHWRRDDLDGLDQLYAGDYPDYDLIHWRDLAFPNPAMVESPTALAGTHVIRSGALAEAPNGLPQALVSVDENRRVVFATLAPDGSVVEAPGVVDQGPLGVTVGSPDVAVGGEGQVARVLVAWTADERSTSPQMQARWAVRELLGGVWQMAGGVALTTSRLTAGFDAASGHWLLAHLTDDGQPRLAVIDQAGQLQFESEALPLVAWELSNPLCMVGAPGCTMLFSTSQLGGPTLGRIDFSVDLMQAAINVDAITTIDGQDVYGHERLTGAGARMRVLAGRHRFELGTPVDATPIPAMPLMSSLEDWPLALGAYAGTHRLATPLEISCGNGVVQEGEDCDDGNLIAGDGCDVQCMLESPGGGTGETGGTSESETGDAGIYGNDDGCNCATTKREHPRALVLGLLGVAGLCRSRRRSRPDHSGSQTPSQKLSTTPVRRNCSTVSAALGTPAKAPCGSGPTLIGTFSIGSSGSPNEYSIIADPA